MLSQARERQQPFLGRTGHPALRRSGALPPGPDRRPEADTRAAMTAESTAACDQQTAEGAGRRSREHSGGGARPAGGRSPREAGGRLCTIRADLPGLRQRHRRCVRPRIPGFSPGGLGPHLTSSGSPRGLSSGFPFARRVLPLRPPSSGFPSSGVLRFVPFGRCPVPVPLRRPSGFPFPEQSPG